MAGERISRTRLRRRLRDGATADDTELRQQLGAGLDTGDGALARALVEELASRGIAAIETASPEEVDGRDTVVPEVMGSADASFLGRLSASSAGGEGLGVTEIDDTQTLLAVLRAGTLAQRRAAANRLRVQLEAQELSNEESRAVGGALLASRDVEIAFEVAHARQALSGATGRAVRQETEELRALLEELDHAVDAFWEGESTVEPVAALPPISERS